MQTKNDVTLSPLLEEILDEQQGQLTTELLAERQMLEEAREEARARMARRSEEMARAKAAEEALRRRQLGRDDVELADQAVGLARFEAPRVAGPAPAPKQLPRRAGAVKIEGSRFPNLLYVVASPLAAHVDVERRVREVIPEVHRDGTWATLAGVRNAKGRLALGAVETLEGERLRGAPAVRELWERTRHRNKIVLIGDTRSGTSLAAATLLEAELRRGNRGANWIGATKLKEPGAIERALRSTFLVLNGLGYELHGAKPGSGWLPNYAAPAREFLNEWYELGDTRTLVVTTELSFEEMEERYGEDAAARVVEGAGPGRIRLHYEPGE